MEELGLVLPTPLAEARRTEGASLGTWFGCALPDHFGDWGAEYGFLRESVALLDKNYRAYLDFTGRDRVRYLNAILTNNIKGLGENQGIVSLFLNPQGRIQAEIETYAFAEKLFCVSFAMIRNRLVEGLEKYIIMDDVTLTDRTEEFGTLALEGPKTAAIVKDLAGVELEALAELESREVLVGTVPSRIIKRSPGGVAGAEFLVERRHLEPLWHILQKEARKYASGPAGYLALNALRLEQGIPWFGYDFGEKQIPHEAGLQDSHISYTKGCYTGQEIVERVRSRGQVNRVRVSLKCAVSEQPKPGTPLLADGKEFGYVTRCAFSPVLGCFMGMGYVRREKSTSGAILEMAGGTATVLASPASASK